MGQALRKNVRQGSLDFLLPERRGYCSLVAEVPRKNGLDKVRLASGVLVKKQAKANFPYSDVTDFYYSSENQLVGFKVYEGGNPNPTKEVVYTYDALGRRLAKNVVDHSSPNDPKKTFNRRYVYDGQNIALEYMLDSGFNKLLARYTHSPLAPDDVLAADITADGVTAQLAQNSGTAIYIKDAQGTVTDITDSAGSKLMHYVYSAFGELIGIKDAYGADVTSAPPVATSFTYTGREHDSESGYYYYRARYYDPAIGRFMQKDPHPGKLNLSTTVVNAYAYVSNNPQNMTDPTGMFSWFEKAIIGVGAAIAAVAVALFFLPVSIGILGAAMIGAVVGAITGAVLGWGINRHVGRDAGDSIWEAVGIGAMFGALAGGITMAARGASFMWGTGSGQMAGEASSEMQAQAQSAYNATSAGGPAYPPQGYYTSHDSFEYIHGVKWVPEGSSWDFFRNVPGGCGWTTTIEGGSVVRPMTPFCAF